MNCPTCATELDRPVNYCPCCGWPAARLTVETPGNVLSIPQDAEATIPLVIRNVGAGPTEYTVRLAGGQPWAFLVSAGGRRSEGLPSARIPHDGLDNSVQVGAVAAQMPEDVAEVVVEIQAADQGGRTAEEPRPWSAARHRIRTWQVHIPIRRLGEPELYVAGTLAVFTNRQREVKMRVENIGGSATDVTVAGLPLEARASWEEVPTAPAHDDVLVVSFDDEAEAELDIEIEIEAPAPRLAPRSIAGGAAMLLVLRADDDFEGVAEVELCDDRGERHPVTLYGQPAQHTGGLVKRWTIGIDFGTAKSAVYYTDNRVDVQAREPRPILWPAGPGAPERTEMTTRSAVMFHAAPPVPVCGHRVPISAGAEAQDELVVESIKTQLRGEAAGRALTLPGGGTVTPVKAVAHFMRYLLDEVRGSGPFRGRTDLDACLVLTTPVMEDQDAYLSQRENTLQAASEAGLPLRDLLTPSEPECAALDLMHLLRRGEYTFGEDNRVYHLQHGEVIMVFDCGAGTTDIAVLRVLLSGGQFGAEQLASAGFRFGGDVVDDLLLSWLLNERAGGLRFEPGPRGPLLRLEGTPRPMPLHAAREECRRLKESLFVEGSGDDVREFHLDLGSFRVGRAHVERLVAPFLETICERGIMPDPRMFFPDLDRLLDDRLREALWREMMDTARTQVRPLQAALLDAGLERSDVTFLFITGGTGQIPIVATRLSDFMGRSQRVVVADAEDCTINVARGAALYYDYHITGILRCDVDIVGRDPATGNELFRERACAAGALPGPELERAVRIGPRRAVEVALVASYPGDLPDGCIAARIIRNPSPEPRQLIIHTEYDSDHTLYWRAAFADGQVVVPREATLQV